MNEQAIHQKLEDRITVLEERQREIIDLLRPISETYKTASTIGRWTMGAAVFVSVAIGVILSLKELLKK